MDATQRRIALIEGIHRAYLADCARRRGMAVTEVERWLAPNLAYEPESAARPAEAVAP